MNCSDFPFQKMSHREISILLFVVVRLVATHYIVLDENLNNYNIVSETTARTYTECIFKCDRDASCSFISIKKNGDGSFSCISLVEGFLNLTNKEEKKVSIVKQIDDGISFLTQLNKTQPRCTSWSDFSQCDVTCDNGTMIRERTCLQKCPNGTRDKYVKERETEMCTNDACVYDRIDIKIRERKTKKIECTPMTQLNIVNAIYGRKDRDNCLPDVTAKINKMCFGFSSCSIRASNDITRYDPCGGEKWLWITYECRPKK